MAEERVTSELLENGTLLRVRHGRILTGAAMEEIGHELAAHANERSLRMVVLQGTRGQFSFGASVEEHRKASAPGMLRGLSRLVRSIAHHPVPVAALVEGRCLGGGFELALSCHLIFTASDAVMGCPEITLGVFPPVLAALGPSRLGGALSDRLVLTGETIGAAEARACGLSAAILEGPDPFASFLEWYRKGPAKLSAAALRIAKKAVQTDALGARLDALEKLYVDEVLASHDGNEGIEAFIARRKPVWEDA